MTIQARMKSRRNDGKDRSGVAFPLRTTIAAHLAGWNTRASQAGGVSDNGNAHLSIDIPTTE
jgi:hypothetical protein